MKPRAVLALGAGHFIGDSYGTFLAAILPLLMEKHSFSLRQAGLLAAVLAFTNHFLQPAWGYFADRFPGRRFAVAGPLVMGICISTLGIAPGPGLLVAALVVGGSGMAAFHPEAVRLVRKASGARGAFGIALFIATGNLGFAFGPLYVTTLVSSFGLSGTIGALVPGLAVFFLLLAFVPGSGGVLGEGGVGRPEGGSEDLRWKPLVQLYAISLLRALVSISFLNFLPILLTGRGLSLQSAGALVTLFLLAGAAGGIAGGYLADRIGAKPVMAVSLAVTAPVLAGAIHASGAVQAVGLVAGGFLLVASHPVNVNLAQSLAPHRAGTVAAFMIGVAFGVAGLLMPVLGALAERYGIEGALATVALAPLGGALLVLALPAPTRSRAEEAPRPLGAD